MLEQRAANNTVLTLYSSQRVFGNVIHQHR